LVEGANPIRVANLILSAGYKIANEKGVPLSQTGIPAGTFGHIAKMIDENRISPSASGVLINEAVNMSANADIIVTANVIRADGSIDPPAFNVNDYLNKLARDRDLFQISDSGAIDAAIDAVIAANPKPLQDYRAGKQSAMGALVGMVMKNGKGLNPKMVQEALKRKLG
jgi:Asp-tRNA(Asn)/Glu-tRNA(Gln) amidotransferase B subunit